MRLQHGMRIMVMVGLTAATGHSAVLVVDDFESDSVGIKPQAPTSVYPATPTADCSVLVIDDTANIAGTGNGVRLHDGDAAQSLRMEYDCVANATGQISAARIDFSFAPLDAGTGSGKYFKVSLGQYGVSQTSSSTRFVDCRLYADGTIDFVSETGPDSTGNMLMTSSNTLSIFVNDFDVKTINYIGPDNNLHVLQTNSVAYWLNGSLIPFGGGQEYTLLQDRTTANGTIFTSSNNIGRLSISALTSDDGLDYAFDDIRISDLDALETPLDSSWLVYNSSTGLVYSGYANEGQANAVNTVPDFSNAGYQGGGVPIPFVPAAVTLADGPGDDTALIQNAIDTVSALPIGANGFRGAVLLTAGDYTVSDTLNIAASGVVIRGEGSQNVGGTRITYTATAQSNLFEVDNNGGSPSESGGTRKSITDNFVPVGATSFHVSKASGFAVGDRIIVQNTVNQQWLDDMSDMSQWGWTTSGYQLKFRRTITAVEGNLVTIDAPIVQTIEDQYGGGEIYKYNFNGELENIGFECLRLESTYVGETDEAHGWTAIDIKRLQNGWVRQVTGRYFGYSLVYINSYSQQITVEDCAMLDPKSIITGGRRYSFNIDDSQYILMQRCLTRGGRHDFVSGSQTPGPNVFVDCRANETYSDTGPHHRYATGQIYDNIMGGSMNVQNRENSGSGHGWAGAQILFWNCDATSIICDAPTGAMNWCVGSIGTKTEGYWAPEEPFGIWDSHNSPVLPRSLYYAQLQDRLGISALRSITLPEQDTGDIWTELNTWDGDGLFLDAVMIRVDQNTISSVADSVAVQGIVRNLQMLDNEITATWSKDSGPGTITYGNTSALETTASFSTPGSYVLKLTVNDGTTQEIRTLQVEVLGLLALAPPADLHVSVTNVAGSILLDWDDNTESNLTSYTVYRSTTSGSGYSELASGLLVSEYTDSSGVNGTTYYYVVVAVDNSSNESDYSIEVSAEPYEIQPPNVMLGEPTASGSDITLSWIGEIGIVYGVQTNSNLVDGEWNSYITNLIGSGEMIIFTNDLDVGQLFFRVIAE